MVLCNIQDNQRLDFFVSKNFNLSRNKANELIKALRVCVNGKMIEKPSFLIDFGDEISLILEKKQNKKIPKFTPEILYEDEDFFIINKPRDLVVHPAPSFKDFTLVDFLKNENFQLSDLYEGREGIVHRLDKNTTGALLVAKTNQAHKDLAKQLKDKAMGRYYLAIINKPLKADITIDAPIARGAKDPTKMVIKESGKEAKTAFAKLAISKDKKHELIACKLFSGRTHQIRVHLKHLNRYVLGDEKYGKAENFNILLHAYAIYLKHPKTQKDLFVVASLPDDYKSFLYNFFSKDDIDEKIKQDSVIKHFDF